ncbi:hypothetical protein [Crocinitomix algicola]|uniref:hypothetical protein n=1 Tax=Crocinitomix algicola TaxID=1740263 RepID=UPI00087296B3|nr:hypothetical protein [Crocinitomix algicola]
MQEKKSNILIALCVMSFISLAYQAFSLSMSLSNGRPTDEQIKQQKITLLEGQTPETLEASRGMIEDAMQITKVQQENFSLMLSLEGLSILIGLIAVLLMLQMRKIGFHLYIIYTLISIFYWTFLFSGIGLATILIVLSILFGILFVGLYYVQSKKMT